MDVQLPYSGACERNRGPILDRLRELLPSSGRVLEIGAGTGQHAVYFAAAFPAIEWQCADLPDNLPGIRAWIAHTALPNLPEPLELDVLHEEQWPTGPFDAVYSANTAHIMAWEAVDAMFRGVAARLSPGGPFCLYGPFNDEGEFTSEGNRRLDAWASETFPGGGIRDRAEIDELARGVGLRVRDDLAMPANNRLLVLSSAA